MTVSVLQEVVFARNVSAGTALGDEPTQRLTFTILDCKMTEGMPPLGGASGLSSCTVNTSTCQLVCTASGGSKRLEYFSNLALIVARIGNDTTRGMIGVVSFTSTITTWAVQPTLEIRLMLVDNGPGDYPHSNSSQQAVLRLILAPRNHEPYFAPYFNASVPIVVCACIRNLSPHPLPFPHTDRLQCLCLRAHSLCSRGLFTFSFGILSYVSYPRVYALLWYCGCRNCRLSRSCNLVVTFIQFLGAGGPGGSGSTHPRHAEQS
jgi:hypothetical protein